MKLTRLAAACAATLAVCAAAPALATSVNYGRVTAVRQVTVDSTTGQVTGAVVGGTIGLVSGNNRSASNQALRGVTGVYAGRRIGNSMAQTQAFEYTVLMGGRNTITMVTDQAGIRIGDCVAVERGQFNNLRLVDDARCNPPPRPAAPPPAAAAPTPPAPPAPPSAIREADACIQAKEQLLKAEDDAAFDRAERRVRLLCGV